jgi:hypothetical protein
LAWAAPTYTWTDTDNDTDFVLTTS